MIAYETIKLTFRSIVNDAEQVDEQRDAVEDWQRPQSRFQRILRLENVAVDEHEQSNAHATAKHRRDEPRADNCSCEKRNVNHNPKLK